MAGLPNRSWSHLRRPAKTPAAFPPTVERVQRAASSCGRPGRPCPEETNLPPRGLRGTVRFHQRVRRRTPHLQDTRVDSGDGRRRVACTVGSLKRPGRDIALEVGICVYFYTEKHVGGRGKKGGLSEYAERIGKSRPNVSIYRNAAEVFETVKPYIDVHLSVLLEKA